MLISDFIWRRITLAAFVEDMRLQGKVMNYELNIRVVVWVHWLFITLNQLFEWSGLKIEINWKFEWIHEVNKFPLKFVVLKRHESRTWMYIIIEKYWEINKLWVLIQNFWTCTKSMKKLKFWEFYSQISWI